jgi:hypothetical protein
MEILAVKQSSLREILSDLDSLTAEDTICAEDAPNWTCESRARVLRIPELADSEQVGPIADYFLESSIVKDALEGWSAVHGGRRPTIDEICDLLIYFAKHDGFSAEQLGE